MSAIHVVVRPHQPSVGSAASIGAPLTPIQSLLDLVVDGVNITARSGQGPAWSLLSELSRCSMLGWNFPDAMISASVLTGAAGPSRARYASRSQRNRRHHSGPRSSSTARSCLGGSGSKATARIRY